MFRPDRTSLAGPAAGVAVVLALAGPAAARNEKAANDVPRPPAPGQRPGHGEGQAVAPAARAEIPTAMRALADAPSLPERAQGELRASRDRAVRAVATPRDIAAPEAVVGSPPDSVLDAPAPAPATVAPAARRPSAGPATGTAGRRRQRIAGRRPGRATTLELRQERPLHSLLAETAQASPRNGASPSRTSPRPLRTAAAGMARPNSIATTVTRIVEVVPRPLRIALGALGGIGLLLGLGWVIAALRARRAEAQRSRLVADVGVLQSALLPALPADIGGAGVSAAYRPAEGLAAGGDFYDAFTTSDGRVCVLVGDVTGHGRDAVPLTSLVRYTVRAYLEGGMTPRGAIQAAANVIDRDLDRRMVTLVAAAYDPRSSLLTYSCAGHPAPLVVGGPGSPTACSSPPLGSGMPTGRRQVTLPLAPGSAAVFFTDGLVDVRVGGGRLGVERLGEMVDDLGEELVADRLLDRVMRSSHAHPDDMVAFVLRAPAGAPIAAPEHTEEFEVTEADLAAGRVERFLTACGVDAASMHSAVEQADAAVASAGRAHVVVHRSDVATSVAVAEPAEVVSLPLAQSHTTAPARTVAFSS